MSPHRNVVVSMSMVIAFAVTAVVLGLAPSASVAAPASASVDSIAAEPLVGGPTIDEEIARQADLQAWLMGELPAGALQSPLTLRLTAEEQSELKHRQEAASNGPAVVGRTKALSLAVRFSGLDAKLLSTTPRAVAGGFLSATADGGFVWAAALRAEGAGALRAHLTGVNLPSDVDLFFFSPEGQAFGPYGSRGPDGKGDFWTNSVFGQVGVVLLRHYGPAGADELARISFRIADVGHIGQAFAGSLRSATESFCSFNVSCIDNASCHNGTPADPSKSATALMQWVSGQFIYTCTGTLLNDTVSTSQIPYFLTANHCISTSTNASNLEAYFQFSISCGSTACPGQTNPGGIQRLGSTIKATGSAGDFTLLQLNQTPPSGSVFMGWNNTPIANTNNALLYRISHPAWAPQAWSSHRVDTSAPTCTQWPRGQRIYSRTTGGGTEGGSSGSAVLNASSQVVGQLSGACGTNVNDDCDTVNNATVDGAFAYYWPSVQPFLDPVTCTPTTEVCNDGIDNDCDGATDCADSNCNGSPSCTPTCSPAGASCTANSQCCSSKCKGNPSSKTCR